MGKVSKLPRAANDGAHDEIVPPFTVTITMNISGERQITVHSASPEAVPRSLARRNMDLLVDEAERQRAKYEIKFLSDQLADKRQALDGVWLKRKDEAEEKHTAHLAEIEGEIVKLQTKHSELDMAGASEWANSNRQGDYKAQGHRKNRLDGIQRDIEAQSERVKKAEAEHLQHMQTITGNVEKLREEIAAIERLLKKHQEIVG